MFFLSEGLPRFEGIETRLFAQILWRSSIRPKACPDLRGLRPERSSVDEVHVDGPKACPDLRGLRPPKCQPYAHNHHGPKACPDLRGLRHSSSQRA